MLTFFTWLELLNESRHTVAPEILQSYDSELLRQLAAMANRIPDPEMRSKFQAMLNCPIVDSRGHCSHFAEYILAALKKHGLDNRYDLEQALQYVFEKMLLTKSDGGEDRTNIFTDFDPTKPDSVEHFRARFLSWVKFAVNNIRKGKIKRLSNVEHRPQGRVSIGQGRQLTGDPFGGVSPEHLPSRDSTDARLQELIADIETLLRRKEKAYPLDLVSLFRSMFGGTTAHQQRAQFGDRLARVGRPIVVKTIEDDAKSTDNYGLLNLLRRFQDGPTAAPRRQPAKVVKPVLSPKERDYASILQVIDHYEGQPVGSGVLGSSRRRWLAYPARTPGSTQNRLEDTLAQMVRDGVLRVVKGSQSGVRYVAGPAADQYRQEAGV